MQKRFALKVIAAIAMMAGAGASFSQDVIKIANIVELSGGGTTAGTNFKNGVELAVKEINAAGGILGKKIVTTTNDTQSNPGVAKGLTQKAVDDDVFAIFGPVFSGSIMVSMAESRRAQIPNFTGGEAASITQQGNPYVFRTSFGQSTSFPKVARYINGKAKTLAVIYVNNDFGKGGRDAMLKLMEGSPTKVVADISSEPGQIDFSAAVLKAKQSNADAAFIYTNEEESARALREFRKQGWNKPLIGETTLTGQKVIELAGDAANGAVAHVGLTVDAPATKAFGAKFQKEYNYVSDHNGIKGYTGVYVLKAAIEKVGKLDRVAVANALKNVTFTAKQHPGVLMDVTFDDKGDIDRESFMVEVKNGKQEVVAILPPLGKK
ncbi:MAG: ABC transporter substrate-binding protein [Gammaproteobacteria bacterium]|nr:ABC transporter substrate-binding protein [Gammaproteobacteria bacterium]MBU0787089.1 ABC transporter substrate-binding protein [Gammaproteobacteria bacterium]MBU0816340.1 ABC transporter substrate-binding protein [Gammaproteobacteria bacterium]MBU1787977.1 ABC transporter substrate-binding protein [Gammaproteobacteria bacterium]